MDYFDHESESPGSPSSARRHQQRRKASDADGFARPSISRSHSSMALSPVAIPPGSRLPMKNSVSRANTPSSPYARSPHSNSIMEKENTLHSPFTSISSPVDRSHIPKRNSSYTGPLSLPLPNGHSEALARLSVSMMELPTFTSLPVPVLFSPQAAITSSTPSNSSAPVSPRLRTSTISVTTSSSSNSIAAPDEDDSFLWDGSFSSENGSFSTDYISDEENRVPHILPTKPSRHPGITAVSGATVVDLIRGVYSKLYRAVHIIDLRYEYEYDGGHVAGAINFPSHSADAKLQQFFTEQRSLGRDSVVVMYCEFSSERGPRALKRLRKLDRDSNISRYPHLDFPYVYLLEGGYSQFFAEQRHHCHPQAYVRMDDPAHRVACVQARSSQRVNKRLSSGVGIIGRALSGNILPSRPDTSSCPLP